MLSGSILVSVMLGLGAAFLTGRGAQWGPVIEIGTPVPCTVPTMLFDRRGIPGHVLLQLLDYASSFGDVRFVAVERLFQRD